MRISSPTVVAARHRVSAERQTNFTQEFAAASGEVSFTVPDGVFYISAVCVGGGGGASATSITNQESGAGGAGGGLHYGTFPVTPGETLLIQAGTGGAGAAYTGLGATSSGGFGLNSHIKRGSRFILRASGGDGGYTPNNLVQGENGTAAVCANSGVTDPKYDYYSEASYNGGDGGWSVYNHSGGGGGGAAGYSGNGGNGGYYNPSSASVVAAQSGSVGGGGGAGAINSFPAALTTISPLPLGGGVGVLGEGSNGAGGSFGTSGSTIYSFGRPGSATPTTDASAGGTAWGGGGNGPEDDAAQDGLDGLDGRVRVIFGTTNGAQPSRIYPNNAT